MSLRGAHTMVLKNLGDAIYFEGGAHTVFDRRHGPASTSLRRRERGEFTARKLPNDASKSDRSAPAAFV